MIFEWKTELEKYGFLYKKYSSSERAFVKNIGVIRQQIWEDSFKRNGKKKIVINTTISVQDPFAENNANFVTVVSARLDSDGVIIPRSEGKVGRYWDLEENNEAFGVLIESGIKWFSEYSDLLALKEFVNSDVVVVSQKETVARGFFKVFTGSRNIINTEVKIKPISRLKLCLIEFHLGNFEAACEHAKEWLKYTTNMPGEPARTIRQLQEMRCSEIQD